jgi:uncharacterized MAPEG superfamily protein
MTPDLTLLAWTIALAFVQVVIAALGANMQVGLPVLAGNREAMPELIGWAGRAQRAHLNMLENLPIFIALILTAHIAGKVDATALLGAQLFFWGRLAHAIIYLAGIPWLRTLAWAVSVVGLVLIFLRLV